MKKWIPWMLAPASSPFGLLSGAQTPKPVNGFDIAGFGRLPVLLNGRVQPFDSVARNALLSMSGRSLVRVPGAPAISPSEWLLEAMTKPDLADRAGKSSACNTPICKVSSARTKKGLPILFLQRCRRNQVE